MVKVSIKVRGRGWIKSGSLEMDLEIETYEDMEKLLDIVKEDFKLELEL